MEGRLAVPALTDADIATTAFWYQTEPHTPFPPSRTQQHAGSGAGRFTTWFQKLLHRRD